MEPISTENWTSYQDPSGFSLRHPSGWQVYTNPSGVAMTFSAEGGGFVLVQELANPLPGSPAEIVRDGRFSGSSMLAQGRPGPVKEEADRASCNLWFRLPDGKPAFAMVLCELNTQGALISVCAADDPRMLDQMMPVLWQIKLSYSGAKSGTPRPHQQMGQAVSATPAALTFVPYTEPQMGTFQMQVPQGWQVRGGFAHPGLGDRRTFVEAHSPDGISVFVGDPNCPQSFYHDYFQFKETFIPFATGCTFLNLSPSAKKLAAYYLKKVAPARMGQLRAGAERDRPDLVERIKRRIPQAAGMEVQFHEACFQAGNRSGHCLAMSFRNKQDLLGGNCWEGNVVVWLTPPGRDAMGEQVALRMMESYQPTQRLMQIHQQDEAMIAGNGNAAVMRQQQWFAGQQAAHFTQTQAGDILTGQYWQTQNAYDGIFQRGSDARLGQERLYDEMSGREYFAPSGANYYWMDAASGSVVGTETNQPPDYQRDYRPMKKG